jgi:kumamolisin
MVSRTRDDAGRRVDICQSWRTQPRWAVDLGEFDDDTPFEVVVTVKRRANASPDEKMTVEDAILGLGRMPLAERQHLSVNDYRKRFGANQADLDTVAKYAATHKLECRGSDVALRTIVLEGLPKDLSEAFGAKLSRYKDDRGAVYRGRTGYLRVPRTLAAIIDSVSGFDARPRPRFKMPPKPDSVPPPTSHSPWNIARRYKFPAGDDGSGQAIAIILGGGYRRADLERYFRRIRRPRSGRITTVPVRGSRNNPGRCKELDQELMLDLEVAGAIVPGADLLVYLAPNPLNGVGGLIEAVRAAVFDRHKVSVISISWGSPEGDFTQAERELMDDAFKAAALMGITVCCASGDWGARGGTDKASVFYPASSPYVLACGGTMFADDDLEGDEFVWNDHDDWASGGGFSTTHEVPGWQTRAVRGVPSINTARVRGRGVPDVAALAAANYRIQGPGGNIEAHGGTSAVAPLWAALIAQLNQRLGKGRSAGYLNPLLYELAGRTGFRSVPGFNSIASGTNGGYRARDGWDPCTGLGSPVGETLIDTLARPR